jgi:hypothetical protein
MVMNLSKLGYLYAPIYIFSISVFFTATCFANHGFGGVGGVGGFHNGVNNYHYNNDVNVGNYHPGNGWDSSTVIINNTGGYDDCQACDSDGNCVQTTDCD